MTSRSRKFGLAWLILLVASNAFRLLTPVDGALPPHKQAVFVAIPGQPDGEKDVRIAYADNGPAYVAAPVAVLLHGSPSTGSLDMLVPSLQDNYRVIAPDLPGFGDSSLRVPDYSFAAHARYVLALLDKLAIERAHFVTYSMGAGVAIELYRQAPKRVASATFISSIGVQELELFGDYDLNHAIHGLQLALFTLLEWGLPHFGYLDDAILNTTYARNFYDSDQRPFRDTLRNFQPPLLIVHGRSDSLVPWSVAKEHHRIVPHSELLALEGGHGMIFHRGDELGEYAKRFIGRVERGDAISRGQASHERIDLASQPFRWDEARRMTGIGLAIMLLLLVLATYVSEDLTCIAAGLLVAQGALPFWPTTIACMIGIYTGDLLLYFAGRHLGQPAMHRAPFKWLISDRGIDTAKMWFQRRGPVAILASRFIPGTRLATYLAAGVLGTSFWTFSFVFLLAAMLWTPLLVGGAATVGMAARDYFERFQTNALPVVFVLAVAIFIALRILLPLMSSRGRRLLLSRWRRLMHWEFWPPWIFYPPVIAYILYLGIRYRGITLFTAANPAIPAGGFVGESKIDILAALGETGGHTCATALLPDGDPGARCKRVRDFMRAEGLAYPIVLKPNVGERGSDVCIAKGFEQVRDYISKHPLPTLAQAYAPGHEFGIFYVRYPGEKRGFIFAITDKRPPAVLGDGHSTLEQLILADDRAVCMARTFLDRHAAHLFDVPARGVRIPLVEIGTHCMGCVFLDGAWVKTDAMEAAIDRISRGFDGFYFGRYDIRTPSVEDFQHGRNFKIVELNGVTSEATNIYDPGNGLFSAYRTLFAQWRHAFEIGDRNRARGVKTCSPAALLALLRRRNVDRRRAEQARAV